MRTLLLVCLLACKQREAPPAATQQPAATLPPTTAPQYRLQYAAKTEDGLDGTNGTYFQIDEDHRFFVVAEAAQPTTAPQAAELMSKAFTTCPDGDTKQRLQCIVDHARTQLASEHLEAQFAAMLVDATTAYFARGGETRVVFVLGGELYKHDRPVDPLGTATSPAIEEIPLVTDATFVLANREVLDTVGTQGVRAAIPRGHDKAELEAMVQKLVAHPAQSRAGAGATSAIVVRVVR